MRTRCAFLAIVAAFAVAAVLPASASAAPKGGSLAVPLSCVDEDTLAPAECTAQLVGFEPGSGGTVNAVLSVTNAAGDVQQVRVPAQQGGTCTILDLVIQPIRIELLGIIIETDTIHIRITARRGTLLGDLLCGLFFGPANATSTVLNQFLRQGMLSTA